MTLRDLGLRLRALVRGSAVERELDDELAFHVECETRKLIDRGMGPDDARQQALARFGSRTAVADDCRDARGTGAVDTLVRDVVYAWRTFRRAPLAALTIVATMTLGLGMATTAFSVFNAMFLRVDAVYRPDRLLTVRRPVNSRAWVPFTQAEYDAFRRETTVFTDTAAILGGSNAHIGGRLAKGRLVSGNFFQVLGVVPARGRVLTPSDDRQDAATALVLSDRGWQRLFSRDPAAIGQRIRVNGADAEIVGIMPGEFFGLSAAPPDFWGPLAALAQFDPSARGQEDRRPVEVVGRLKPDLPAAAALDSLKQWAAGPGLKQVATETVSIALTPSTGLGPEAKDALPAFAPLFFAFALVLLIGCANVANMLLARGLARQAEIGIRLSLGASRRRIARQLLTENLLLALMAAACAYPAARLFMQTCLYVAASWSPPEIAEQLFAVIPALDWHVLAFLAASAIGATAVFGVIPALHATRLDPVRTMRGEVIRDARPSRVRRLLITTQVAASALLLIAAALLLRGALSAVSVDTGLHVHDVVLVSIGDETRRAAILNVLAEDPMVSRVSVASSPDTGRFTLARTESTSRGKALTYRAASSDFLEVMGIPIVRGRGFLRTERSSDAGVVLVSARTAHVLWPDRDAIGQILRLRLDTTAVERFTVVGVVRDVVMPGGALIRSGLDPELYVPAALDTPDTQWAVRVRDEPFRARAHLIDRLSAVAPALGSVTTLETTVGFMALLMRSLFAIGLILASLALLLTVSGLFSVLSYIVEQRTKEIGVRMALGASGRSIVRLLFVESGMPVGIGLLVGALLAAGVAGALMASPLASEVGAVVRVFDPAAYAMGLVVIVLACMAASSVPALRAVHVNPSVMLRKD
jgi:predicted permease